MKNIQSMSEDEIGTLLDDEIFFDNAFVNFEGVKELGENFAKVMANLKRQAEANLELKEKVDTEVEAHDQKYREYEKAQAVYQSLKEKEKGFSSDVIVKAINEKLAEFQNEESDILKGFKSKDLNLEEYVEAYRKNSEEIAKYSMIKRKIQ